MKKKITEYQIAKEIFTHGREIILSDSAQSMKGFTQHGTTSVFEHAVSVAKYSLIFAQTVENIFGKTVDRSSLVRGALLHDYFLYDWHEKNEYHNLHGFTHPGRAFRNACRDYELNDKEKDIIRKHMFPLTPIPPKHLESFMVCIADKWCAICETFKVDISSYIIYRVNLQYDLATNRTVLKRVHAHHRLHQEARAS